MPKISPPDPKERTVGAIRSVADDLSDWSSSHDNVPLADEAAGWARQAAAQIEDDAPRRLAYEARRRVSRPQWTTALAALAVGAAVVGVVVWASRCRGDSSDSKQEAQD